MSRPPPSALRRFLASEAAGGLTLIGMAGLALAVANSPLASTYFAARDAKLGPFSVLHWVNDVLMTGFFFLVGLEIKREWTGGQLERWSDRALPGIAALAGMVVPALIYLAVVRGEPGLARGWAVPAATDIAFALGVLALAGRRVPGSLKLFLTTVAIVDDIGAIIIIALFYTSTLDFRALGIAAGLILALIALARRTTRVSPFLVGGAGLWFAVHASGVHATVAGVIAALLVPAGPRVERVEHALAPWIGFIVLPLFAFANAGVDLRGLTAAAGFAPLPVAIALGLFLGKQAGVFGGVRLAIALGLARKPYKASWRQIYGVAVLCGVGFTMSLFIGGLAFLDPVHSDAVKIGVLAGSVLSALAGFALLRTPAARAGG